MINNTKSRIFIVTGPSQLLFLSATLLKDAELNNRVFRDILVFSSVSYPEETKVICKKIAKIVWQWDNIIWLTDIGYHKLKNKSKLISNIFTVSPAELWLCMPYNKVELEFQKYFYDASIVRYDDGLGTYVIPNTIFERLKTPSLFVKQLMLDLSKLGRSILDIIKLRNFSLPRIKPKIRYGLFVSFVQDSSKSLINVDWRYLSQQLDKFEIGDSNIEIQKGSKKCLIIGQYFSLLGFLDRQEELNHYIELCNSLFREGFTILWKEHPKNKKPFFNDLQSKFEGIEDFNNYHSSYWPLEIVVKDMNIDLFIATTSTSLINLEKVFGFKTKSSVLLMKDKLVGADKEVAEILLKNLKPEQLINLL